jgi:hypothetical protein
MPPFFCRSCGAALPYDEPVPRDAECPSCGQDARCCLNCRHYDPRLNNSCRETEADPVAEKNRRNFCEFFSFHREPLAAKAVGSSREADARRKLDQLFGGASGPAPPGREPLEGVLGPPKEDRAQDARRKLDSLFGRPKPAEDDAD